MAYVGTPRYRVSDRYTLASIIAGEAGNQGLTGMQAVGAVMANRAALNFSGYGNNVLSQALAQNQFQGQSAPTSASYSVADALLAGTNPDPTGGATYYANPGASSAAWATNLNSSNSYKIGSQYFTNNTNGVPFAGPNNFITGSNNNDPFAQSTSSNDPNSAPSGSAQSGDGYIGAPNSQGNATLAKATPNQRATYIGKSAKAVTTSANPVSTSVPRAIDAQTAAAAKDTTAKIKSATKIAKASTKAQIGFLASVELFLGSIFVRFGFIVLGFIFIASALFMMANSNGELTKTLPKLIEG